MIRAIIIFVLFVAVILSITVSCRGAKDDPYLTITPKEDKKTDYITNEDKNIVIDIPERSN